MNETHKQLIELACAEGQQRLSPQTGLLHYGDCIPLYENLLYALNLLHSKQGEAMKEGLIIIQRVLPFYSGGFPRFLHEFPYPAPSSYQLAFRALFSALTRHFYRVFDKNLKTAFDEVAEQLKALSLPAIEGWKWRILSGDIPASLPWDRVCACSTSNKAIEPFFEYESAPCFLDLWVAAQINELPRRLSLPSRAHLEAALIEPHPIDSSALSHSPFHTAAFGEAFQAIYYGYVVQGFVPEGACSHERGVFLCELPPIEGPFMQDGEAVTLYFPKVGDFTINEGKASVIHLGDRVRFQTPEGSVALTVTLEQGEGTFMGHILRGNRKNQTAITDKNDYRAFDWKVTFRSMRRSRACALRVRIEAEAHAVYEERL